MVLVMAVLLSNSVCAQDSITYPDAREVASEQGDEAGGTLVLTSPVSEVGERLRFSDSLTIPGERERVLLEASPRLTPTAILDYYQDALGKRDARILFSCAGRECGRSAIWANRIFDQSRLYGQDGEQAYVVGAWRDEENRLRILNVYVVRRGNRTISILEQQFRPPEDYRIPGSNPLERQILGPFIIPFEPGLAPKLSLASETGGKLSDLAEQYPDAVIYLTGFAPASLGGPQAAMQQAQLAVDAARQLLESNGVPGPRQVAIAVGAAVPVDDPDREGPRVEVTLVRQDTQQDE